jgi:hypothetical protein
VSGQVGAGNTASIIYLSVIDCNALCHNGSGCRQRCVVIGNDRYCCGLARPASTTHFSPTTTAPSTTCDAGMNSSSSTSPTLNSGGGALDVRRSVRFGHDRAPDAGSGTTWVIPFPFAALAATRTGGSSARRSAITASTRARPRARSGDRY